MRFVVSTIVKVVDFVPFLVFIVIVPSYAVVAKFTFYVTAFITKFCLAFSAFMDFYDFHSTDFTYGHCVHSLIFRVFSLQLINFCGSDLISIKKEELSVVFFHVS